MVVSPILTDKYSIEVKRGQTLIFTFIGFTKKEVQVNQSAINVVMEEDSQTLDEVVVVGYGSMTRKDVTSSITTVKADDLNVGVYTNPAQLLQGKVPGLTIAIPVTLMARHLSLCVVHLLYARVQPWNHTT